MTSPSAKQSYNFNLPGIFIIFLPRDEFTMWEPPQIAPFDVQGGAKSVCFQEQTVS